MYSLLFKVALLHVFLFLVRLAMYHFTLFNTSLHSTTLYLTPLYSYYPTPIILLVSPEVSRESNS